MSSQTTTIGGIRRPTPCDVAKAHLAKDVYNDSGAPAGWHRVGEPYKNDDTGFYAQLYAPDGFEDELKRNSKQGPKMCPPTLAFRGTNFDDLRWNVVDSTYSPEENSREWVIIAVPLNLNTSRQVGFKINGGDWANNFLIALGKIADQYSDADKAAAAVEKTIYGPYVNYTGHSLGGGLAARVGINNKKETVTFNSAGVQRNPANNINPATAYNCTNYWVTDEILTTLQENPSRLPYSNAVFDAAKKIIVTPYNSFEDLPDGAGSKVNLRMEPIKQPDRLLKEGLQNSFYNLFEKDAADMANKYIDRAMNQYGQGVLSGNIPASGNIGNQPRMTPNLDDGIMNTIEDLKRFYNEAIRRHSIDVVLSLMEKG